jgi:hypothetical protein
MRTCAHACNSILAFISVMYLDVCVCVFFFCCYFEYTSSFLADYNNQTLISSWFRFSYNGEIILYIFFSSFTYWHLTERSISRSWLLLLDAHKMRKREGEREREYGWHYFLFFSTNQDWFLSFSCHRILRLV